MTVPPAQRQQIKWVVLGISAALSVFIGMNLALGAFAPAPASPRTVTTDLIGYLFLSAAMLLIPVSISIAMLRHRYATTSRASSPSCRYPFDPRQ